MRERTLLYFCVIFLSTTNAVEKEFKIVNIAQGPVKGYKDSEHGIYEFRSIPYASVPTGRDRFKAPLPPPVWMDPLEAVKKDIMCPQATYLLPMFGPTHMVQEDCLIASVYVPDTEETNLPVVFAVHGGAFQLGHGDMILPKIMIKESNIIYVTFNYRLGAHGFLSLGTEDVPGNAGMKDQVTALRWVKNNIASFGGNPDDITLHGFSAGSASVDLLMISKSTNGLFNKVIPESGANVGVWSIQSDPLENAKQFARELNFTNVDDINALEDFYKTVPFEKLMGDAFMNRPDSIFVFSPVVERASSDEVFLDKSPVDILKSGDYPKVPILYGFANMEGLFREPVFNEWKDKMNEKFADFLPRDLTFESIEQKEEVANKIKEFYFGDEPVQESNILKFIDYYTDVLFAYPMLRAVKYHVEAGHKEVYLYEYSFVDENTPFVSHTNVKGANHCAQTFAVFDSSEMLINVKKSNESQEMSAVLRSIWSNFIKTGKPTPPGSGLPAWPAAGAGCTPHMSLAGRVELRGALLHTRTSFWDHIYEQYYWDPLTAAPSNKRHEEL